MTSEQRQLRQTVIFLRTSFEAVQHSIAGRLEDPLPCWMDTSMLSMLSRELTRCCQQSKPLFAQPSPNSSISPRNSASCYSNSAQGCSAARSAIANWVPLCCHSLVRSSRSTLLPNGAGLGNDVNSLFHKQACD
ncbi:hypothetical protein [Halomonas sp. PA16-9]|uniref:hypothetical protein n=1 Tax=Halomonas sp. PA16-9 TaxID=2576841 RepID=UPI0030ECB7FC